MDVLLRDQVRLNSSILSKAMSNIPEMGMGMRVTMMGMPRIIMELVAIRTWVEADVGMVIRI